MSEETGQSTDGMEQSVLYLLVARCPDCDTISRFVEKRESRVNLMQDVAISAEYCPKCGVHLRTEGYEWDVHEDAEIERVPSDTDRSGGDVDA